MYAPYQPRFEWNLWFASLARGSKTRWFREPNSVLLANDPDVLALFARNPFPGSPPLQVRALLWQYWFTSGKQKRMTGDWWRRPTPGASTLQPSNATPWAASALSPCPMRCPRTIDSASRPGDPLSHLNRGATMISAV